MKRPYWTRERYYRAHHLLRLFCRFKYLPEMPNALTAYCAKVFGKAGKDDPLLEPIMYRLGRFKDDKTIPY